MTLPHTIHYFDANGVVNDNMAQAEVLSWLDHASPKQMHCVAITWNWDYGLEIIQKVIESSECDARTAIICFFNGVDGGTSYADESPEAMLIMDIAERLKLGFYKTREFSVACHPTNFYFDPIRIKETLQKYGSESVWGLPFWVFDYPLNAEPIDCSKYDEGNPPELVW